MHLEPHYRLAKHGDAAAIARHRYFRGNASASEDVYATWVERAMAAGNYIGVLCNIDGETVGGAGIVKLDWGPTAYSAHPIRGRLANVFVEEHRRRCGLGLALVERALAEARKGGLFEFCLASTSESRRLYERLGFSSYPGEMVLKAGPT